MGRYNGDVIEGLRFAVAEIEEDRLPPIEERGAILDAADELEQLRARWAYIKADPDGARALLQLGRDGKGCWDDFDTMVDRIIESRKGAADGQG